MKAPGGAKAAGGVKYYLIHLDEGVDVHLYGPWKSDASQEKKIRTLMRRDRELHDEDGSSTCFWMEMDAAGKITMGGYNAGYMDGLREEVEGPGPIVLRRSG